MVTSISTGAYSADALRTRTAADRFTDLKAEMDDLSRQLSTGKLSDDWSGLGPRRVAALDYNASIARLDGYAANITDAQTRIKLMDQAMTAMNKERTSAISALNLNNYQLTSGGTVQGQTLLSGSFGNLIDYLNTGVNGRYFFSGRSTDVRPVASMSEILNGANGQTGLVAAIAARRTTDQVSAQGGLTTAVAGNQVTVTDGGANGFGLPGASTFDFTTPPGNGQSYTLTLSLPDGTTETVSLAATTGTPAAGLSFAIDPSPAVTAANFKASLDAALGTKAQTSLAAASAMKAATDFFTAPTGTQVQWYRGDTGAPARNSAMVRADDGTPVASGAAANEAAFRNLMIQYGVMAAETFSAGDPNAAGRYDALRQRIATGLGEGSGQKVLDVETEIALANADIAAASERNKSTKAMLQDQVGAIEDATPEQVAAQLLSLQTQLQASYQVTSMVSKLSLVNYL